MQQLACAQLVCAPQLPRSLLPCCCCCCCPAMQGLNLLLLGNQGQGAVGNCSFNTIEIAIFSDVNNAPSGTAVYGASLRLGQAGKNSSRSFRYWGNYSSVVSMDIVDKSGANTSSNPPAVELDYNTVYWLRVQVAAAYGAAK